MPRTNPGRTVYSEDGLAARIAYEREARDLTYERLAQKMTAVGCKINTSAIYKIEKGRPRRRIAVDELVALSKVFGIDLEDMLLPPEIVADRRARDLVSRFDSSMDAVRDAIRALEEVKNALREHVDAHPATREYVKARLATDAYGDEPPEMQHILRKVLKRTLYI